MRSICGDPPPPLFAEPLARDTLSVQAPCAADTLHALAPGRTAVAGPRRVSTPRPGRVRGRRRHVRGRAEKKTGPLRATGTFRVFFSSGGGRRGGQGKRGGGGLAVAGRAGQWGAWRRRRLAGRGPDGVCVRACVRSSMHACVLLTRHECDARTSRRVLPGREQNGRAPRRPALTCHPSSRWVLSPGARSRALMAMLCDALYYIWSAKGFRRGTMAFSQWLKKPHCDEPWPRPSGPSRCGSHGGKTVSFEYGRTACP